ncbi:hypothetical protein Ancab_028172 [Ancistrocladus abbreviatus]
MLSLIFFHTIYVGCPLTLCTGNPRRLSVQCNIPNFILRNSSKLKYVCSIQSFDRDTTRKVGKKNWEAISKGKLLRVLDFGSTMVEEVPNDAEDLLNLRYLKINAPSLTKFPTFLVNLWNLQALDMRSFELTNAVKFPEPSSELLDFEWSLQTLSTIAPGQGTTTLVKMGAFASMTRLGLSDSSLEADWSLLADLNKMQNLDFDGDLPYSALAALAYVKSIRVKGPVGGCLRSLETLKGMVKNKCSIVIIPEQWRDFLKNLGDA